jgi:hypothetical protein
MWWLSWGNVVAQLGRCGDSVGAMCWLSWGDVLAQLGPCGGPVGAMWWPSWDVWWLSCRDVVAQLP